MTDGSRERHLKGDASPKTKRWVARREEVRAAAAKDQERALKARALRQRQIEREYHNPGAFLFGLLMVVILLVAGWFVIDWMSCDPFYSDLGLSRSRACR
jgi:hypothetical protein